MNSAHRADLPGRLIGMLVFFVGVGLLLMVFKIAYDLFMASPAAALGINITGDPKRDPAGIVIGQSFVWMMIKILLLFLMSAAASLVAQKGINLYFSGVQGGTLHKETKPSAAVSAEA